MTQSPPAPLSALDQRDRRRPFEYRSCRVITFRVKGKHGQCCGASNQTKVARFVGNRRNRRPVAKPVSRHEENSPFWPAYSDILKKYYLFSQISCSIKTIGTSECAGRTVRTCDCRRPDFHGRLLNREITTSDLSYYVCVYIYIILCTCMIFNTLLSGDTHG